jgi:squalene-hopene/tetraprenyl-beta-curcumene cyclase
MAAPHPAPGLAPSLLEHTMIRTLRLATALVVAILVALPRPTAAVEPGKPASEKAATKDGVDRALRWLRGQQGEDGSWSGHPGITSLVALAYFNSPRHYKEDDGPYVSRAVSYLLTKAKPNGAIFDRDNPSYNTALAIRVLAATGNPAYRPQIEKARDFLISIQTDEDTGYPRDHKYYGGIGYGGDERPDLSNLQFAIEGLKAADTNPDDPVWAKAITFLNRCQNRSESNDQAWAANDGGFVYAPGESFAGGTTSYGSMTFAGIKSLIFAHVERSDPRVQAGLDWLRAHYSVDEHPGLGQQGYYYYADTFARTLGLLGRPTFRTADGEEHPWAEELARALLTRQADDGSWSNPEGRWWEGNKHLATAHAVLALSECYPFLPGN